MNERPLACPRCGSTDVRLYDSHGKTRGTCRKCGGSLDRRRAHLERLDGTLGGGII